MLAHIAGVPVEETALSLAPVAATVATAAGLKLRNSVRRDSQRPSDEIEPHGSRRRPSRAGAR